MNEQKKARSEPLTQTEDVILPFQLEATGVRGRFVRLGSSLDQIIGKHRYPKAVSSLLAQACAVASALGTSLKFDGVFTVQTRSDGAVSRLVVDVTSDGAVRACAQFDQERLVEGQDEAVLLGKGHLVFTVDQKLSDERYQGVVPLEGKGLIDAFQLYFRQSEQIPTGLLAAALEDETGHWHSGCLMLQRMPTEGGLPSTQRDTSQEDDWFRSMALMQTGTPEELTDNRLPLQDLLFRLFHEEGVRVYDAKALYHACRCSEEKILGVLRGLPPEQVKEMVRDNGMIDVTCEFCAKTYYFKPEAIFPAAD